MSQLEKVQIAAFLAFLGLALFMTAANLASADGPVTVAEWYYDENGVRIDYKGTYVPEVVMPVELRDIERNGVISHCQGGCTRENGFFHLGQIPEGLIITAINDDLPPPRLSLDLFPSLPETEDVRLPDGSTLPEDRNVWWVEDADNGRVLTWSDNFSGATEAIKRLDMKLFDVAIGSAKQLVEAIARWGIKALAILGPIDDVLAIHTAITTQAGKQEITDLNDALEAIPTPLPPPPDIIPVFPGPILDPLPFDFVDPPDIQLEIPDFNFDFNPMPSFSFA